MVHGILHYCGYKEQIRSDELSCIKEDEKIQLFHVEPSNFINFLFMFHVKHFFNECFFFVSTWNPNPLIL